MNFLRPILFHLAGLVRKQKAFQKQETALRALGRRLRHSQTLTVMIETSPLLEPSTDRSNHHQNAAPPTTYPAQYRLPMYAQSHPFCRRPIPVDALPFQNEPLGLCRVTKTGGAARGKRHGQCQETRIVSEVIKKIIDRKLFRPSSEVAVERIIRQ